MNNKKAPFTLAEVKIDSKNDYYNIQQKAALQYGLHNEFQNFMMATNRDFFSHNKLYLKSMQ